MNLEIQKRLYTLTPKRVLVISLLTFILLMLAITSQIVYSVLSYDRIYRGVFVNDKPAGALTTSELKDTLNQSYQDNIKTTTVYLKGNGLSESINFSDINVAYDIDGITNKAYSIGRTGNLFTRIQEIYSTRKNGVKLDLTPSFDKAKLESIISSIYNKTLINVKEADLLIQDNKVTIRSGHHGESIDKNAILKEVENLIKDCKSGTINVSIINTPPSKINVEDFYKQIIRDPVDASTKVENNVVSVVPHIMGRDIDKSVLASIAAELEKTENTENILPVIFSKPKLLTEDVKAMLFKDTLATMYTQFYTATPNDANRGENIKLAVSKINGKILAPGEVFSFNDVVGPRTDAQGYKIAHVYSDGKIVDDVGGGICQVSTTLYNAVLFSDLDVQERTNHMFTVGYVPFGRDAAVSYGSVDFKFKNSSKWPIRIEGWVTSDNKIYFSLRGTSETPGKTIEVNPIIVKTLDVPVKYIDDPNIPEGQTEVIQEGMPGYVVDTYKIVKNGGKVVSETKIHTSVYNPLAKEIKRGVKKA